jgi:hypothetical protein
VLCNFGQLTGEKSLVPKGSEIRENSAEVSKGIFGFDICQFESWRPSQPVPPFWGISGLSKSLRNISGLGGNGRSPPPALRAISMLNG